MKKVQNQVIQNLIETMPAFILEMAYCPHLVSVHTPLSIKINDTLKKDNASDGIWTRDVLHTSINYIEGILKKEELDPKVRLKLNKLVEYGMPVYENIKLEQGTQASYKAYREGSTLAGKFSEELSIILND